MVCPARAMYQTECHLRQRQDREEAIQERNGIKGSDGKDKYGSGQET